MSHILFFGVDTARVFPPEPAWLTFKAFLIPEESRPSDWDEEVMHEMVVVELSVKNWVSECCKILQLENSKLVSKRENEKKIFPHYPLPLHKKPLIFRNTADIV